MHGTARLSVCDRDHIELNINSDPANLAAARTTVEEFCSTRGGFGIKSTGEIGLVVNEALANVIRHAYSGATDQPIRISVAFDATPPGSVTIAIRDWGSGENPQARLEHHKPVNPATPGGLGLVCLREFMDEVRYAPQSDGMLLTMMRQKKSPEE